MSDLRAFWDHAWAQLRLGAANAGRPARLPSFATVSPEGWPEARTVALRGASEAEARLEVHTDTRTAKIAALKACPRAALLFWVPEVELQIRVQARVELVTGPDADAAWARVPEGSRVSYGTQPAPGERIAAAYAYAKPPDRACFAVLACTAETVDLVELGAQHRRAGYARGDGFKGVWLAP